MVMGLAGLTIAWAKAQHALGLGIDLGLPLLAVTAATFASVFGLYGLKLVRYRAAVVAELSTPEPGEAPITGPDRVDHDALAADENNNENPEGGEGGETAHGGAGSAPRDGERPEGEGERET